MAAAKKKLWLSRSYAAALELMTVDFRVNYEKAFLCKTCSRLSTV